MIKEKTGTISSKKMNRQQLLEQLSLQTKELDALHAELTEKNALLEERSLLTEKARSFDIKAAKNHNCAHCLNLVLMKIGLGTASIRCFCKLEESNVIELTATNVKKGCPYFSFGTPEVQLKG